MASIPDSCRAKVEHLYYAQGLSARRIADELNVSIDAVYYFMRRHALGRRSFTEENRLRFSQKEASFNVTSNLSGNEERLRVIGTVLYWCEGYKSEKASIVDFANSDPAMVKIFVDFLKMICGVNQEKLRVFLYCYSNQSSTALIDFWSGHTGIPKEQFSKPYIRNDFDVKKKNKMPYGLVHIRYGDKKLLLLIKEWIKEYKKMR